MEPIFITNLNKEEYKELLRETFREVLKEKTTDNPRFAEILNAQQASEFLHLRVASIYEKTSTKQIPHFKKGNKLYFNRTELEAWIQQGKVKTADEIESQAITYLATNKKNH
ncbi:MAG: helix-turn-helix domain-containing protein [Bacteroidota bacterium]